MRVNQAQRLSALGRYPSLHAHPLTFRDCKSRGSPTDASECDQLKSVRKCHYERTDFVATFAGNQVGECRSHDFQALFNSDARGVERWDTRSVGRWHCPITFEVDSTCRPRPQKVHLFLQPPSCEDQNENPPNYRDCSDNLACWCVLIACIIRIHPPSASDNVAESEPRQYRRSHSTWEPSGGGEAWHEIQCHIPAAPRRSTSSLSARCLKTLNARPGPTKHGDATGAMRCLPLCASPGEVIIYHHRSSKSEGTQGHRLRRKGYPQHSSCIVIADRVLAKDRCLFKGEAYRPPLLPQTAVA